MKTEKYIVAFIDILGFKKMINDYDKGNNPRLLNNISIIVNSMLNFLDDKPEYQTNVFNTWRSKLVVKSFSDCFCIGIPFEYKSLSFDIHIRLFYQHIALFQTFFLQNRFLVRGGISIGSFYSDKHLIFSGGLVDAYELESKKAKYPRILVSDKFLNEVEHLRSDYKRDMFVKEENEIFINPFNFTIIDSREANEKLEQIENVLPGNGIISGDFEESAIQEKVKIVKSVRKIFSSKSIKPEAEPSVVEKFDWIVDFCDFQLTGNSKRFKG
jgi:hypothetical protein